MNQLWPGRPPGRHWPDRRLPGRHWLGHRLLGRRLPGRPLWLGRNLRPSRPLGRSVKCGRAVTCRAVHHLRWTRHWSRTINLKLPGRRRDHSDSSLLRRLDDLGRQLHFPSGNIRRSGPIVALSSSLLMTGP